MVRVSLGDAAFGVGSLRCFGVGGGSVLCLATGVGRGEFVDGGVDLGRPSRKDSMVTTRLSCGLGVVGIQVG